MSDTDTSKLNLYQKLAAITGEIGKINKTGQSSGYGDKYTFIEYGSVAARLRELFAKYGVIIIPYMQKASLQHREDVTSKNGAKGSAVLIDFTFVVRNADKPDEKFSVTWTGEAIDYGDKATNKAATAALKYYLMRQFNISEKGDDPDAESPEGTKVSKQAVSPEKAASAEQIGQMLTGIRELYGLLDKADVIAQFVKLFKVEPTKVPASNVEKILKRIAEAKAKKADADMQAEAESAQESAAAPDEDLELNIVKDDEHDPAEYLNGGEVTGLKLIVKREAKLEDEAAVVAYIEEVAGKPINKILKSEVEDLKTTIKHRQIVGDKPTEEGS